MKKMRLVYWLPGQSKVFSSPKVFETSDEQEYAQAIETAKRNNYEIERMTCSNDEAGLELDERQRKRCYEIYDAAYEFCKVLAENEELEWDADYIEDLADYAADMLAKKGIPVRFPSVSTGRATDYYQERS